MDILRKLIIERTKNEVGGSWALDVYYYLIGHGVESAVAIDAMTLFIDDVIDIKAQRSNHE